MKHDPIRLQSAAVYHIRPVLTVPFTTSFGTERERDTVLVILRTADGLEGYGECTTSDAPLYNEEFTEGAIAVLNRFLLPALGHGVINTFDELSQSFNTIKGHHFPKCAIESAYWQIVAQQTGTPLKTIFGSTRDEVMAGFSIGAKTPEGIFERAQAAVTRGFKRLKIKIWPEMDIDAVIGELRRQYPDLILQVDANASYDPFNSTHRDQLKALDAYNLLLIEQPFAYNDIYDHARFQHETGLKTPICLDESIHSAEDARRALTIWRGFGIGERLVINVKPPRVGGYRESVKIADYLHNENALGWVGGMLELGLGKWLNITLASHPAFTLPGDHLQPQPYYLRDIFTPLPELSENSTIPVPERVKICELDYGALDELTAQKWEKKFNR